MKYFKQLEDKYLNKPFLIDEPNVPYDIQIEKDIPNEFFFKNLQLLKKINVINKHISMILLKEKVKKLLSLYDGDFDSDGWFNEITSSEYDNESLSNDKSKTNNEWNSECDNLSNEIRKLANSLPTQRTKELIKMLDDVDLSDPKSRLKINKIVSEMKHIVKSESIPLFGIDYVNSISVESLFYNYQEYGSRYAYILDLFNKLSWSYNDARNILSFYYDLFELADFTNDDTLKQIDSAFEDLKQLRTHIHIPKNSAKPDYISYPVPDAWYILPGVNGFDDILYNTTGEGGHKEASLEYLELYILSGGTLNQKDAEKYFELTESTQKEEFIKEIIYNTEIKYGLGIYHQPNFLESSGEPYGTRKNILNYQKNERAQSLQYLNKVVPEDKQSEFSKLFQEYKQYFNLLEGSGLPYGYLEIINKAFEYDGASSESLYVPNKQKLSSICTLLRYIQREVIVNEDACKVDLDKYYWMRPYLYNPVAKDLVVGVYYAHALMIKFFADLHDYAKNYKECIQYLKQFNLDNILIRACGFNKVTRRISRNECYKVILTSNPNYENDFKEYLDKGWNIEYLPPIIIDKKTGELKDYLNSCEDIKTVLCTHEKILRFSLLSERVKKQNRQ